MIIAPVSFRAFSVQNVNNQQRSYTSIVSFEGKHKDKIFLDEGWHFKEWCGFKNDDEVKTFKEKWENQLPKNSIIEIKHSGTYMNYKHGDYMEAYTFFPFIVRKNPEDKIYLDEINITISKDESKIYNSKRNKTQDNINKQRVIRCLKDCKEIIKKSLAKQDSNKMEG